MFVVSAGDHSMSGVTEGDGENAGGVWAVDHRRVSDCPGSAGIGGMEYASDLAAGREPDIGVALHGDAGSAGSECAFAFDGGRKRVGWKRLPMLAAILGSDQFKS